MPTARTSVFGDRCAYPKIMSQINNIARSVRVAFRGIGRVMQSVKVGCYQHSMHEGWDPKVDVGVSDIARNDDRNKLPHDESRRNADQQ